MTSASDELWTTFGRYADGLLSPAEIAELEARMTSDPAVMQGYLLFMAVHGELAWTHRAIASGDAAPQPTSGEPVGRIGKLWRAAFETASLPLSLSLIVASLVISIIVLSMALWPLSEIDRQRQPHAPLSSAALVAQVVRDWQPRWEVDGYAAGEPVVDLAAGQRVTLRSGAAEVRFDSGALVLLRGPITILPRGDNRCELLSGDLTAWVPQRAVGFTIETPQAELVDLGTEFGVGVNQQSETDLHVYEGVVEVHPRSAVAGSNVTVRQVHAGQSLRMGSDGSVGNTNGAPASSRFLRVNPSQPLDPRKTEQVVFQQGQPDPFTEEIYSGCDDAMLLEWATDVNFGGRGDFDVGNADERRSGRTLIRFDLSSMKGKFAAIRGVTLRLTTSAQDYSPAGSGEIQVLRLSNKNAAWQEGAKTSSLDEIQQQPGDSTWNHLHWPATKWSGSSGAGKVRVDYWPVIYATKAYRVDHPHHTTIDLRLSGDLSFVEAWANGEKNAGLLLKNGVEDAPSRINFYSSEAADVHVRPELVIEYVPADSEPQ